MSRLNDLSMEVARGQAVGLIGPNGAGKTTLFNILTGVIPPSAGSIRFQGREIVGRSTHDIIQLGLARTFQNLRLFKRMTVFDNVWSAQHRLPGMPAGGASWGTIARPNGRGARGCYELLELTGLLDKADVLANKPAARGVAQARTGPGAGPRTAIAFAGRTHRRHGAATKPMR